MTRRNRALSHGSAASRAGRDAMAIATGAPQVIAMRVARMAAHGPNPSASDRREMHRMVDEKNKAFSDAWTAMGAQSLQMQKAFWQSLTQTLMQTMLRPWWLGAGSASPAKAFTLPKMHSPMSHGMAQVAKVAAAGLAPVSRRVRSNVTRLKSQRTR